MSGAQLLIINSLQGGGGHRVGRIFSCYNDVYWYSHDNNGFQPWEFALNTKVKEAQFSKMHYDRLLSDGTRVPLIGSRIEKYWDNENWYYNWLAIMSKLKLPKKYITYVVHDSPEYLRRLFPKSYIVNLICDPKDATDHHMKTSANFRIDFKLAGQRPNYKSKWVKLSDAILDLHNSATEKEAWEFINPKKSYYNHMLKINDNKNEKNIKEKSAANITIDKVSFDPTKIEDLGKLDVNYKRLMRS